ncbi:MAG TPA: phenylalanine--tRNA ligase subunit beta [Verrucomicrobiae bacterium]|nr:phenylalanine--tRNA ligase subunit beta [Verrucomicrobiae bacterium]
MKVTLNWLKQYVDFNWSPEELTERLTLLGLEVENVQKISGEFEGIVVAQVVTRDKHPNADKLSLCRVNDGKGERQIVCGAQNFKAGDKVPLILPGASLPLKPGEKEPFTIKVGKIRGMESQGMMCSPQELGLPDQVDGLLILREDAIVGQPFAEYLGRAGGDVVYDLEITPNRPDWNSVIGIAREISALTGNPLKIPDISEGRVTRVPDSTRDSEISEEFGTRETRPYEKAEELVAVRIEDPELCPRYTARVIKGVKIGPSPDWLRNALEKAGVRSINNVVDVTNFVMLEIGQPLHAFDYHLISKSADGKPVIVVRRAKDGESFVTLDGQKRSLTSEMLLIADEQKGIALAGIMGGQNTEIQPQTTDVLIESAYFNPTNIRRTSKTLGLRSESSYRFERGADVEICDWASRRAAQLILKTAGGHLAEGAVDVYPKPSALREISLRHRKVNELLGIELSPEEMEFFLGQLGLKKISQKPAPVGGEISSEPVILRIPSFRVDLKREVDLIEEIARLHGVEKIPSTPPRGAIGSNPFDAVQDEISEARQILRGLGLNEAQGQTLISKSEARTVSADEMVALSNPLSSEMDVLRPSLLTGLIHSLRHNISRKSYDVALFEIGRVFSQKEKLAEERRIAIAITGRRNPLFWSGDEREAKFDIYDLKGLLEEFFEQFGMRGMAYQRRPESAAIFLESASIQLGKQNLGEFGQLLPALAKQYDLRDAVFLAELNLDLLLARRNPSRSFKALPAFPSSRRDVAMLVPENTTHDSVLQVVRQTRPANLESVELFDVFRGKNLPAGQKSMAYALTYRNAERTLTDAEVNAAHEKVVEQLRKTIHATIREQ